MFGFLKKKLKGALDSFSKKAVDEAEKEDIEEVVEKPLEEAVTIETESEDKPEEKQEEKESNEDAKEEAKEEKPESLEEEKPESLEEEKPEPVEEESKDEFEVEEKADELVLEEKAEEPEPVKEESKDESKVEEKADELVLEEKVEEPEPLEEEKPEPVEEEDESKSIPEEKENKSASKEEAFDEEADEEADDEKPEEKEGFFSKFKSVFSKEKEIEIEKEESASEEKVEEDKSEPVEEEPIKEDSKPDSIIKDKHEEKYVDFKPKTELKKVEEKAIEKEKEDFVEELSKEVEKEKETEYVEEEKPEPVKEKEQPKKDVASKPQAKESKEELAEEEPEKKQGFFSKVTEKFTTLILSEDKFDELFFELEVVMLENNVAFKVIERIKEKLKEDLVNKRIKIGKFNDKILKSLQNAIISLFDGVEKVDIIKEIKSKKGSNPYVVVFLGVNGSGKTTSIAKFINYLKKNDLTCAVAASDTFRAAAIQQLEAHTDKLGVKLIKHDYGSDPAAVAFDTIKYAKSKGLDCVIVDTAGRLHSNTNLMAELKKIIRVSNPDHKIFVGESVTGNDCVEQAELFDAAVQVDSIFLTKADVDDKGGAAISISYVTNKPIIFLGTGQEYDDLKEFDDRVLMESIFGE